MSERAKSVLAEVLGWPVNERGDLAARLLESLDAGSDADAAAAWDEEIRTRLEDVRLGRVTPVPWAEALRQIEADGPD
jgi:putative addiction module component (TIGR02574 family)